MRILLKLDDIETALASLSGWKREGTELAKTFRFPTYLSGIEFVSLLGHAAEALDHHPDLLVTWRKVQVRLTTHSAGGITQLDVEMAKKAEQCSKKAEETAIITPSV